MKTNLRGKIREFIQSEEGKVGIKSPLTLGVAAGGFLLAHAVVNTPQAEAGGQCWRDVDCVKPETCHNVDWFWNIPGTCH